MSLRYPSITPVKRAKQVDHLGYAKLSQQNQMAQSQAKSKARSQYLGAVGTGAKAHMTNSGSNPMALDFQGDKLLGKAVTQPKAATPPDLISKARPMGNSPMAAPSAPAATSPMAMPTGAGTTGVLNPAAQATANAGMTAAGGGAGMVGGSGVGSVAGGTSLAAGGTMPGTAGLAAMVPSATGVGTGAGALAGGSMVAPAAATGGAALGSGMAAGTGAVAGAGAAGTLGTVGAANAWNPVGWAALAALAAYGLSSSF